MQSNQPTEQFNVSNVTTTKINGAAARLMVVRLKMSKWAATKFDKGLSDEVAQKHGADDSAEVGRFNKKLLKRKDMKALSAAFSELRALHYAYTAPWSDDGIRVLPSALFYEYREKLNAAIEHMEALREEFIAVYPKLVEDAREHLPGNLYNENDYPDVDEMRDRFKAEVHFEPLPDVDDVRVWGLSKEAEKEIAADIKESIDKQIDAAHRVVVNDVLSAARDFVERMRRYSDAEAEHATKGGKPPRMYDSAVENLREIAQIVIDGLNIADDKLLAKCAAEFAAAIEDVDAGDLKEDATVRADKVAAIESTINKFRGVFQ